MVITRICPEYYIGAVKKCLQNYDFMCKEQNRCVASALIVRMKSDCDDLGRRNHFVVLSSGLLTVCRSGFFGA